MKKVYRRAYDDTTCLDWSSCSKLLAVGSKDTTTKLYSPDYYDNFNSYTMGGHTDKIVGVFFEKNSLDAITVSRNGQICLWESSIESDDLVKSEVQSFAKKRRKVQKNNDSEDDFDEKEAIEKENDDVLVDDNTDDKETKIKKEETNKFFYKKLGRHYIADSLRAKDHKIRLSAVNYHKETKLLVTDVNLIHTLSISEHRISSISISPPGDWIAFGCPNIGQLLVWEWQSEQYVLKQQGHSMDMTCLSYSPDGLYIVTGGYDGKVKVWNTMTGFCFVTFSEHSSAITSIVFSSNKKFFLSSSLDGTVRYRNFRTLTSPSLVQFSCAALDSSSELCAAGGQDVFEIFVWSIKFGKLLEVLGGHEAPVVSIAFSPTLASSRLISGSWDKTVRIWNCIESGSENEVIHLTSDVLQVAFRPDGDEIAVSTLDGTITFFDPQTSDQTGSIEGRNDLEAGRSDTDLITPEKMMKHKAFTTVCYSADGSCILAAGNSKYVCLYSARESILIKKFAVTQNRSLDAVHDYINRRNLTEFGNMALVEERTSLEGGDVTIRLPGVKSGDMGMRNMKPEVRVHCVRFSPTGESFAVAATEGLLMYSQNAGIDGTFRPFRLEIESTPDMVRQNLSQEEWGPALVASIQLNEQILIQEVVETIPPSHIELIVSNLEDDYSDRLLAVVAALLENSRHLELMLLWVKALTTARRRTFPHSILLALEKVLSVKYTQLSKVCDFNKYTIQFMSRLRDVVKKEEAVKDEKLGPADGAMDVDSDSD
ncbi:Periodic tryptophan protein 2 homolog [Eumeta japonica]|uniref:Periodic tryptophan protein 2 homolog n=1 Tax=Eumeta variegata TaxID=151549 RepID=A0A4C1VNB0_EUMVA|nr:Periodic tryptophan protein 2 homolog [Eumeta japonica]